MRLPHHYPRPSHSCPEHVIIMRQSQDLDGHITATRQQALTSAARSLSLATTVILNCWPSCVRGTEALPAVSTGILHSSPGLPSSVSCTMACPPAGAPTFPREVVFLHFELVWSTPAQTQHTINPHTTTWSDIPHISKIEELSY